MNEEKKPKTKPDNKKIKSKPKSNSRVIEAYYQGMLVVIKKAQPYKTPTPKSGN